MKALGRGFALDVADALARLPGAKGEKRISRESSTAA